MKSPAHLKRVRELPCCITGKQPVEAHHIRVPGITGTGNKASDYLCIPLSPEIHHAFHNEMGRQAWEMAYGKQIDHVAATLHRLYGR